MKKDINISNLGPGQTLKTIIQIISGKDSNNKLSWNTTFALLQSCKQQECESVDDRLKLQAQICDFRDARESNESVQEQFIVGIRHPELHTDVLSTDKTDTAEQATERSRMYEASISHMKLVLWLQ